MKTDFKQGQDTWVLNILTILYFVVAIPYFIYLIYPNEQKKQYKLATAACRESTFEDIYGPTWRESLSDDDIPVVMKVWEACDKRYRELFDDDGNPR